MQQSSLFTVGENKNKKLRAFRAIIHSTYIDRDNMLKDWHLPFTDKYTTNTYITKQHLSTVNFALTNKNKIIPYSLTDSFKKHFYPHIQLSVS